MRIWFNRGFSLAPISAAMIAADPTLEVYASVGEGMPAYEGPTETWVEPNLPVAQYVEWAREMVIARGIDILIPTRYRKALSQADLPCRVELPGSIETLALLEDKYDFAEAIRDEPFHLLTTPVETTWQLESSIFTFPEVHGEDAEPCVKPRKGVNGLGFWHLTKVNPTSHLLNPDERKIRVDLYLDAMRAQEVDGPIDELVLMEFLPGPEISFDILAHHGRLLKAVARTKQENGRQRIQSEHPLKDAAARLIELFNLHGVVNVQFRKAKDGSWKALEINSRPAGGVVYGEKVGARIIADWAGLLTSRLTPDSIDRRSIDTEIAISNTVLEVS
jgi:hypothetical protein